MNRYILGITAFTSGAVVMVLELTGSRIVAPYLGTSTIIWTSLIGIILASLSVGYWWGGKLADKKQSLSFLASVLVVAAVLIALIPYLSNFVSYIVAITSDLYFSATLVTLLLFSPATVCLGVVTPYVVRLSLKDMANSGQTVGRLYALSTIGSIVGTFLGGFVLISFLGSGKIMFVLSLTLSVLALLLLSTQSRSRTTYLCLIATLSLLILVSTYTPNILLADSGRLLLDTDTKYSRHWVYELDENKWGKPARILANAAYSAQSGVFIGDEEGEDLVFGYINAFELHRDLIEEPVNILAIGGGTFTYPRYLKKSYPKSIVDAVEIDGELIDIAKKYFYLEEEPAFNIHVQDGRNFVNNAKGNRYELLILDAFGGDLNIPYHLITKEAVIEYSRIMTDEGLIMTNIVSGISGPRSEILRSAHDTFESVFPHVSVYKIDDNKELHEPQNLLLIAASHDFSEKVPESYRKRQYRAEHALPGVILTDDFAPVEKMIAKLLL